MVSESFVHACAGGAGGLVAMTATYPLMGISTRAAVDQSKNPGESVVKAVTKVIAAEGILGLYDGLGSSLLGIGVSNFVYYFFFEASRDFILTSKKLTSTSAALGTLTTAESILAGLLSGTATALISNPIWVVNTRQTVRATHKDANEPAANSTAPPKQVIRRLSFLQTLRNIVEKDGVQALWKGIGPALVLVTNPVLQYTVFEQLKAWVLRSRAARQAPGSSKPLLGDFDFFWLGALSKLVATAVTYPQIVIKSRQQAMSSEASKGRKKVNVYTAMTEVIQDEGFAGLYRGISSKLLQSILTAAILFTSKERIYLITKTLLTPAVATA
ncbi:uncharacterized protein MJAP1_003272 [Malassezia japonica]|uniref:Uncharacterized protein n=1 Tax=Malassezia japonica TaxID=223818 RepID=A0AAF0F5S9_9BASI|nr:uncharacterized protein MJAP1_003272 [Malassezia japonica]WFD40286.1 hypothetical protein MJAP1_003272 [Malassezia japonica]